MSSKVKWQITVDQDLSDWYDVRIKKKRYASRTHAAELGLQTMKEKDVEKMAGFIEELQKVIRRDKFVGEAMWNELLKVYGLSREDEHGES